MPENKPRVAGEETGVRKLKQFDVESWKPKTEIGRKVKAGEIKTFEEVLAIGHKILEWEIVEVLMPDLQSELLSVGQSKGKFGGGKRSIWKQTQKKTQEGNKPKFATMAVVGNKKGYVGIGYGKSKETVPAREKAIRNAKLNMISIRFGCGSWEGDPSGNNSIPFAVEGKCGSVRMKLIPAPKGTSLIVEKECAKVLELAGIKDIYSKTFGHTKTKLNLIKACFNALENLSKTRIIARAT
ncbi:MAG: 30S ribosomal protein S5 [Candidatus Woesearchaeota archaeon]